MPPRLDRDALRRALREALARAGPSSATALRQELAISQPAFSRLVGGMHADVLVAGRGRATRYAGRRRIADVASPIVIYEVDEEAASRVLGTLHPTEPRGFHFEPAGSDAAPAFFGDLPWFLDDLRPNGFLGRLLAARHSDIGPNDVRLWSADQCLRYLTRWGWDLPGSLIVGEEAFRLYLERSSSLDTIARGERGTVYPQIAADLLAHGVPGSSAGGEQPKFLVHKDPGRTAVLVKLSPPTSTAVGRRVGDLLVVEHLAHEVLRAHGRPAARSEIVEAGERVFLEVERFDRTPGGGRRGLLSLAALDAEHAGASGSWSVTVEALVEAGVMEDGEARGVRWLELFGHLIANTDMHPGNLSFFARGVTVGGLAPAYDMSPTLFAPQGHEVVDRTFRPRLPHPGDGDVWEEAFAAACSLWRKAATDERISRSFQRSAAGCLAAVERMAPMGRRLPQR